MFDEKNTLLDFHMRQCFAEKTQELARPIYSMLRAGFTEAFDTVATYEQDTLVLSVNGYSRFIEHLTTAYRDPSLIVSMIINYRSSLVLNFGKAVLSEIEKDIFSPDLLAAGLNGQKGLLQLTSNGKQATLSGDVADRLREFDILASYLFLYNVKFFVYNMDIKIRPDEEKK